MQPGGQSRVVEVQRQVDQVKGVMQENVEVMLANIDKTEVLENKSAALADQAKTFHKTARATRKHMCMQNAKMNAIIACICLLVILAVCIPLISYFAPMMGNNDDGGNGDEHKSPPFPPPPPPPSLTEAASAD